MSYTQITHILASCFPHPFIEDILFKNILLFFLCCGKVDKLLFCSLSLKC